MSSMASFHPDYKLLDDMVLDEDGNEAICGMKFDDAKTEGDFAAHPAYVDAITQVAGFAMNAKDETDITKEVWVNHGWGGLQIWGKLEKGRAYEVYVKMERKKEAEGEMARGDVVVLEGDKVVAFFEGLAVSDDAFRGLFTLLTLVSCSSAPFRARRCTSCLSRPLTRASDSAVASRELRQRRPRWLHLLLPQRRLPLWLWQ